MKYISYELSMNYLMNNKNIFIKIKNSFLESYRSYKLDYKKLLKNKDFIGLEKYIHSIKGISLNLGAKPLYDACVNALQNIRKELWDNQTLKDFYIALRKSYKELDGFQDN